MKNNNNSIITATAIIAQTLIAVVAMTLVSICASGQDTLTVDHIPTVVKVPKRFQPLSERPVYNQEYFCRKAARRDARFIPMRDSLKSELNDWVDASAYALAPTYTVVYSDGTVVRVKTVGNVTYVESSND